MAFREDYAGICTREVKRMQLEMEKLMDKLEAKKDSLATDNLVENDNLIVEITSLKSKIQEEIYEGNKILILLSPCGDVG